MKMCSKVLQVDNWSEYLLQQLCTLYNRKEHCDLTLLCNNERFNVHRAVLCASSEYFRSLKHAEIVILPNDVSIPALKTIISFMYTGKLEISGDNKRELLYIMNLMKIPIYSLLSGLDEIIAEDKVDTNGSNLHALLTWKNNTITPKKQVKKTVNKIFDTDNPLSDISDTPLKDTVTFKNHLRKEVSPIYTSTPKTYKRKIVATRDVTFSKTPRYSRLSRLSLPCHHPGNVKMNDIDKPLRFELPEDKVRKFYYSNFNSISYESEPFFKEIEEYNDSSKKDDAQDLNDTADVDDTSPPHDPFDSSQPGLISSEIPYISNSNIAIDEYNNDHVNEIFTSEDTTVKQEKCSGIVTEHRENGDIENTQSIKDTQDVSLEEREFASSQKEPVVSEKECISLEKESVSLEKKSVILETGSVASEKKATISEKGSVISEIESRTESIEMEKESIGTEKESVLSEKECMELEKEIKTSEKTPTVSEKECIKLEKELETSEKTPTVSEKGFRIVNVNKNNGKKVLFKPVNMKNLGIDSKMLETIHKIPELMDKKNLRLQIGSENMIVVNKGGKFEISKINNSVKTETNKKRRKFDLDNVKGPWECGDCGVVNEPLKLDSYYSFRQHIRDTHKVYDDSRYCEYCGHKSVRKNLQLYHLYVKHDVKPPPHIVFPKCNYCNYTAISKGIFEKHMQHHLKTCICICEEAFVTKEELDEHVLNCAKSKRDYRCTICNISFDRMINLKAHVRINHKHLMSQLMQLDGFNSKLAESKT